MWVLTGTKWNDKEIKAANEGTELPDTDSTVIFRSDESGTSDNFQKFLKTATGNWDDGGWQVPCVVALATLLGSLNLTLVFLQSAMSVFEKAFLADYPDANFSYTSSGSAAGV